MKTLLLTLLLAAPLAAQDAAPAPSYDRGMALRRAGDHSAARENLLQMLERDPQSNGALEGLALSCISLKRYAEAREALEKWNARSPGNPYVLGLLGWDWLARAGLYATPDGLAQGTFWLRGLRETRLGVFQSAYSHGSQEFYSASADGRLRFVQTDRFSAGLRRGAEGSSQASVSAAGTLYTDGNRLGEAGASLTAWPRWGPRNT